MAHSKCLACRARVWREGDAVDHLGDLCPGCGGPLEPVSNLSKLIGFRALRARPRSAGTALPDRSQRIAAEIARPSRATTHRASGGPTPIAGTTTTGSRATAGRA
jgi:hypothetical protein